MSLFNFKHLIAKYSSFPLKYIKTAGFYDYENGGEYKEKTKSEEEFEGSVVPLSKQELKYAENGRYKKEDRKLYCYKDMEIGGKVEFKGRCYTIDKRKDYSDFDPGLFIYVLVRGDMRGTDKASKRNNKPAL